MKDRAFWMLRHALKALLACCLLLWLSCASADELHTLLLPCEGGGTVGLSSGKTWNVSLRPASEVRAVDGSLWEVEDLARLPGFRLLGASLRWTAEDVRNASLQYTVACGKTRGQRLPVLPGRNLWDVTAPFSAWLSHPDQELLLMPAHLRDNRSFRVPEGSAALQLGFTVSVPLPAFPLDRIHEDVIYDAGLSLLEEDSPFIARYDDTAESLLQSLLPLGVPYYYGGRNPDKFLHRYYPLEPTDYYRTDHMYFCGLDCVGLTKLVYERRGLETHPSIFTILRQGIASDLLQSADPAAWPAFLLPGDLIAVHHGTYHILMYLGTLRQFGWSEADAGDALPVLDAPLVLHCGENPFYYLRYQQYIQQNSFPDTFPPDGGVTVSVVQADCRSAPHLGLSAWGKLFGWYLADGSPLTVFPLDDCTEIAWYSGL